MAKETSLNSVFIIIALMVSTAAAAQRQGPTPRPNPTGPGAADNGTIEGRVVLPSGQPVSSGVKIRLSTMSDAGLTLYTDNNGSFSFRNLRAGTYYVEAAGEAYDPVNEQVRLMRGARVHLLLHLKEKNNKKENNTGAVVSAGEIDQDVPPQAKQAYRRATRLSLEGKHEEAIAEFKLAIARYPTYLMAHNDLGVQYLNLKRPAEAEEHFVTAIEINSKAFNPRLNLGIALVEQKKYLDALEQLTQAVSLDSSSPSARLYMGIVAIETDDLENASRELQAALSLGGEPYWLAHFYLAQVHLKNGEREGAVRELNTYLEKPADAELAARARLLLDKIK